MWPVASSDAKVVNQKPQMARGGNWSGGDLFAAQRTAGRDSLGRQAASTQSGASCTTRLQTIFQESHALGQVKRR